MSSAGCVTIAYVFASIVNISTYSGLSKFSASVAMMFIGMDGVMSLSARDSDNETSNCLLALSVNDIDSEIV